jgi:hypothetical protein
MRYELKRNKNGMITQCETNADGGNIYAQREEINKIALQNLKRPTPGKLGNLSNLQVFNFNLADFSSSTSSGAFFEEYNETVTTGNVTNCIMFNVDSINNKASYYNIVDIKANLLSPNLVTLDSDSYVEFYLLENIEGSTTSLGRKIPARAPVNGTSSGTVTWTTTGAKQGFQYTSLQVAQDPINIPQNTKGIRTSGLALKSIKLDFRASEDLSVMSLNFIVYVDITSVSNSY